MLPILFVVPIIQLLILSFAATFEIKNVRLYAVDLDRSTYSRELLSKFEGSPFFEIVAYSFSYEEAEDAIKKNVADQIIYIPDNFEKDLIKDKISSVQIITNAINGNAASLMNAYAMSIIQDYNINIITESLGISGNPQPIQIEYSFWYNPDLNYTTYMVPGILVLLVTIIGMFLSGMNVVREKEIGTIEQINVSPIKNTS